MLSAYSDKHNPHMVASLFKLAEVLPEAIGEHVERAAEAVSQRQPASKYLDVLEGLIRAWASRRQVRLTYRDPISGARSKRLFDPFFIEPSFIGYSCYVYGFDHFRQANRSFKLERLERVEVLDIHFEPPDFDPYEYLKHAWGIRGGYEEEEEVKVRFSKGGDLSGARIGLAGGDRPQGRPRRALYADVSGQSRFGDQVLDSRVGAGV